MEETKQTSAPMYKSLLENGFSAWQKAGNAHKAEALGAKLKKLHG